MYLILLGEIVLEKPIEPCKGGGDRDKHREIDRVSIGRVDKGVNPPRQNETKDREGYKVDRGKKACSRKLKIGQTNNFVLTSRGGSGGGVGWGRRVLIYDFFPHQSHNHPVA